VYKFGDGRTVTTPIGIGESSYDRTEIISGLKEGDLVITGPADPQQNGTNLRNRPVEIVDPPKP
jgi:hypothetical protein